MKPTRPSHRSHSLRTWRLAATCLLAAALAPPAFAQGSIGSELAKYVAEPDASYAWRELRTGKIGSVEYSQLMLTSHTWRGIPWKHQLFILRPPTMDTQTKQGFLFIHGGGWKADYENPMQGDLPREARIFARLAEAMRAPVAIVRQIPFQPLFDRREDALIAYTFDHYLRTGEGDWPLLLPMVKSAARAMDAVQEFTQKSWQLPIEKFTVAGASKRGWTSWLTAAIDPRVASVAPMVIDMLNLPEQIKLQRATFGELSEEVADYDKINLPDRIDSELGRKLISMVDPYSYRAKLTQPKLIMLGTNDQYWPLDALKLYWGELTAPKHVLYVPNQGHGLRDFDRLIGSLSALHRYSSRGELLPKVSWEFTPGEKSLELSVSPEREARSVLAWTAGSSTRDFRQASWGSKKCRRAKGKDTYTCSVRTDQGNYSAMYAEVVFADAGAPDFSVSTTVCIAGGREGKPQCQ